MSRLRTRAAGALPLVVLLLSPAPVPGGELKQRFPADKPVADMKTHWRVVWDIERPGNKSEVLFIKEAYFKRGPAEAEIKVLDDCRLADIFVPYNKGKRIYDISGYGFTLVDLDKTALGPACVLPGVIYDRKGCAAKTGPVAVEVHDGHVRWMNGANTIRRGQGMAVWAVLAAENYRYIILYDFRDDGSIGFRLGPTAHNLYSSDGDENTHLHTAWWRLNVALGDATKTTVSTVALKTGTAPQKTVVAPVAAEAGIKWVPEEFTRLRIESTVEKNKHNPAHAIGYDLVTTRMGSARYCGADEEFTQSDFWVTKPKTTELWPKELPTYSNGEALGAGPTTIWHQTPVLHAPRDEDFGPVGTNRDEGVAITVWAGCDLKPRNFFPSTPLYP